MMIDAYMNAADMKDILPPSEAPNLRTGAGHGHFRGLYREKSKKDAWAKKRRRAKMKKASRRRNRGVSTK